MRSAWGLWARFVVIAAVCSVACGGSADLPAAPDRASRASAAAPADPCGIAAGPVASRLTYVGATSGEYGDATALAALLTDASGNPLAARTVAFAIGGQTLTAQTGANGVAQVQWVPRVDPAALALSAVFAGDGAALDSQASATFQLAQEETALRILGSAAFAQGAPQAVSAQLTEADGTPIAGKAISFAIAGVTASGTTDQSGTAQATLTLPAGASGAQQTLAAQFAGDADYLPAAASRAELVYTPTQFVIWGGNAGGLSMGAHVQFWGAQWASQVTGGNYAANPSFKGYADSLSAFALCASNCWSAKPGNSFPPAAVPAAIGVIVSDSIAKSSSTISGDVAALAVLRVDQPSTYANDPGHPGFGTIVGVIAAGSIFPSEPNLVAAVSAPAAVLPRQAFTAALSVTNAGGQAATSVVAAETLSAGAPPSASASLDTIAAGATASAAFAQTAPPVAARQAGESSGAYQQRLGALDGTPLATSVRVSSADAAGASDPDVVASAVTSLSLPRIALGIAAPASALPGTALQIAVTLSNIGTAAAAAASAVVTLPDGTTQTVAVNALDAGASATQSLTWLVPPAAPIAAGQSAADYAAQLAALDGRPLNIAASATWADASGNAYGAVEQQAQSVERLPILALTPPPPQTMLPSQVSAQPFVVQNLGSCSAASATVQVQSPDGSASSASLPALAPGQSATAQLALTAPAVAPKQAGESDAAYLARLAALDNSALSFTDSLTWTDSAAQSHGPESGAFPGTLVLPIVTSAMSGPATALPGSNLVFQIATSNSGHAAAMTANVDLVLPGGAHASLLAGPIAPGAASVQTVNVPVAAIAPRGSDESVAAYEQRLASLDGTALSIVAATVFGDAVGNAYGPTSAAAQVVEHLPRLQLKMSAGTTPGSYTMSITNAGLADAANLTLTLVRPDGSTLAVALGANTLAIGATLTATATDPVPASGSSYVETASLTWGDANGNTYGPITDSVTTQLALALTLTPSIAGPDVVGTTQAFSAILKTGNNGTPVAGAAVQFTVTGANAGSGSAVTDATGTAHFSYTGTKSGTDTVQASSSGVSSNPSQVTWLIPVQSVSTSTVFGRFFASNGSGIFDIPADATPAFTQFFPTINFNPPRGTVPGNTSINELTRPFTDVVTDINGNFVGTIVAQGNGFQAGVGTLFNFKASFVGSLTVPAAGNVTFNFFSDDGFYFAVGGGATRVSGPMVNAPPSGLATFTNYPVMGSLNVPTSPVANTIVVSFPAAGTYGYELDYSECCGGQLALTMAQGKSNTGVPPTGALTLTPNNPPTLATGQTQTFTALATDAAGNVVPNVPVALIVTGANPTHLSALTDATGHAHLQYRGVNAGTDTVQAGAPVSGMTAYSNIVSFNWTPGAGGGGEKLVPQGWIGGPATGTVVQVPTPITVASGVSLSSGTLTFWPTSDPSAVTTLNPRTTGSGAIGTFDPTVLPNGGYVIQLDAVANGTAQLSQIAVTVVGGNKPGRMKSTVTEFHIPLAGIPVTVARSYDSIERAHSGDFGFGWKLGTTVDLSIDASGNVTFTQDGQRQTFFFQPQPTSFLFPWVQQVQYVPQAGEHGTLTSDGCQEVTALQNGWDCLLSADLYQPTVFTYTDPRGRAFTIGAGGDLRSVRDLSGNTITITPSGITSSAGQVVVPFTRDSAGRITAITDPAGNTYQYSYDQAGNLASVQYPGIAAPEVYSYSADHLLLSETDPRGNTSTTTYDANGRLKSVTTPAVPAPGGGTVRFTTQFQYDVANRITKITAPDGGVTTRQEDTFGNPVSVTDPLGHTTTYTYDSAGNLIKVVDPLGHTTSYTYDAHGNRTSTQLPGLPADAKGYNAYGGVISQTDPARTDTYTTTYDDNFNPVLTTDLLNGPNTKLTSQTWDSNGNMTSWTDATGSVRKYAYSPEGYLLHAIDPLGGTTSYTYDPVGRVASVTKPNGTTTHSSYDAMGRLARKVDAAGVVMQYAYDGNGNRTDQIEAVGTPLQRTTHFDYDGLNRLAKITYADGTTRQFFYDFRGNRTSEIDQLGRTTTYGYDAAGNLVSLTRAAGTASAATVKYAYDAAGRKVSATDELNNTAVYTYDGAGRMVAVQDALGNKMSFTYDADGQRTAMTDGAGHTTVFQRDARGQVVSVAYPTNPATSAHFAYDGLGHPLSQLDANGHLRSWQYDAAGHMVAAIDALGNATAYSYDANENLVAQTDANRHTTSLTYDALDRRIARTLPLGQTEIYAYDALGRLVACTDFNGHTTTYSYDGLDRLVAKLPDPALNEPGISYAYTASGQRASMTDASGATSYTYDDLDRLIAKATPEGTLTYTYDAHGNVLSMQSSNPDGAWAQYAYDADNRLTRVVDERLIAQGSASAATTYGWDAAGNLVSVTYPNSVQSNSVFDSARRLTQTCLGSGMTACSGGMPLASYAYSLAPAGQRTGVTELGGRSVAWSYDAADRLVSESITSAPSGNNGALGYSYDAAGNRVQLTSSLASIAPAQSSFDANDRLSSQSYDAAGNALSSGGMANAYDFENRLIARGSTSMTYDGDDRRVDESIAGTTTRYLIDDRNPTGLPQIVEELVDGAVARTYTYGIKRISQNQRAGLSWKTSFYGYDGHGSVRALLDPAGAVTDTYEFEAFGNQIGGTGTTPNAFLYSGERFDGATGLYDLRARQYDPATGRFLTMDSQPGDVTWPSSLHRYIYAENDPVNGVDPTGHEVLFEYVSLLFKGVKLYVHPPNESPVKFVRSRTEEFADNLGRCLTEFWSGFNQIFTEAMDGTLKDPNEGQKIGDTYAKCVLQTTKEFLFQDLTPFVP